MICVSSPGLPTSPRLMFDPKLKRASVSFRHATWRSHEWALMTGKAIGFAVLIAVLVQIWGLTGGFEVLGRIVIVMVAAAVLGPWLGFLVRRSLQGFLARRIFASRTSAWFTRRGIAFRSSLFPEGVLIWWEWRGLPVSGSFSLSADPAASERGSFFSDRPSYDRSHFDSARVLRVVLRTLTTATAANQAGSVHPVRAIPITEIDEATAERVSVVFSTAAALTMPRVEDAPTRNSNRGVDIDTI